MTQIIDLDDCPYSYKHTFYGGAAGKKVGIVYQGEMWMLKRPKSTSNIEAPGASYTTAPLSEYLGSHIYGLLGIPAHDTFLAERQGKLVVACKDFAPDNNLAEIRTVKNSLNEQMSEMFDREFDVTGDTHFSNLEELMLHLDYNPALQCVDGIKARFFEQAIVDILLNNNDRNNGNWGILRTVDEKGNIRSELAPVFDNGASFQIRLTPRQVEEKLSDVSKLKRDSININTSYGLNGHQLSAKKFMAWAEDYDEFRETVTRLVPLMQEKSDGIRNLFYELPEAHTLKSGETVEVCSHRRAELFIFGMHERLNEILVPEYRKIM